MQSNRLVVLVATTGLAFGLGCASTPDVSGTWVLWSIDGLPTSEAFPSRLDHVGSFGAVTLAEGQAWTETVTDTLTMVIQPDGEFRETALTTSTLVMAAEVLEQISGRRWVGPDPARETSAPSRSEQIGAWSWSRDSLVLSLSREQTIAALAARIRSLAPNASEETLRGVVEKSFRDVDLPPRYRGVLEGDRLVLTDVNGRKLVLRRAQGG